MKHEILKNIRDGLVSFMGKDSDFQDLKMEDIKAFLPGMVTVNRFIGMDIQAIDTVEREIGSFAPLISTYNCDVVILVKGAEYDTVENEMDIVLRRLRKYFANDTGGLAGLQVNEDNVIERVLTYKVEGIRTFDGKLKGGDLGHVATLSVIINTELTF